MIPISAVVQILKQKGIDFQILGQENLKIDGFSSIYQYKENTITWLRSCELLDSRDFTYMGEIALIITGRDCPTREPFVTQIRVDDPRYAFFEVVDELWGEHQEPMVSPMAYIAPGAQIGKNVSIGPFSSVSAQTVIGDGTVIGDHVSIRGRVKIGRDCTIQSGVTIGEDGFAFVRVDNKQVHIRHYGGVTLHDHVSIGANTCVCRGTIDDTEIFEYAKVDNLCHIAHNVQIGARTIVVAGSVVMGSAHVGQDSWISTSLIRDQRRVGNRCVVGMGAVVTCDVMDDTVVRGNPAKSIKKISERIL